MTLQTSLKYGDNMTLTLQQLAQLCNAEIQGDPPASPDLNIIAAADIVMATAHQVTFLGSRKYLKHLKKTHASACFISPQMAAKEPTPNLIFLLCDDPEISFLQAIHALHPATKHTHTISKQTAIADSVLLGKNINIGAFSTLDEHTKIGDNTQIFASVSIGRHVKIGKNCTLYPQVVIYDHTEIGDNVIIHAGTIIGADGFGYKYRDNKHIKVPHVGNVVIADNVEIGANTCIDRGSLGSTTIGAGTKIDNLVQLGHNNKVGRNVIICGQSSISGSCTIEDGAILAGCSGLADHVTIGQQAVVMARSGVDSDVQPKTKVFGCPARDRKTAWRELAALKQLPALLKQFKALEHNIKKLIK